MVISCPLFKQCKYPHGCFVNVWIIFERGKFLSHNIIERKYGPVEVSSMNQSNLCFDSEKIGSLSDALIRFFILRCLTPNHLLTALYLQYVTSSLKTLFLLLCSFYIFF